MRLPYINSKFKIQNSKFNAGFTLVELLVVIGVLGVLAAGLLATVDPLEQFRKAADSNRRSTSLELVNGVTRYYASKQAFPWDAVANGGDACNGAAVPAQTQVSLVAGTTAFNTCLTALAAMGELKSTFASQYQILNALYITEITTGSDRRVAVCFNPDSKSLSSSTETIYDGAGVAAAACDTQAERQTAGAACFYCAQ